jgi:hypothetical protein
MGGCDFERRVAEVVGWEREISERVT